MSYRAAWIALSCFLSTGCLATGSPSPPDVLVPGTPDLSVESPSRLTTFVSERRGIRSVILSPSLVDGFVAAGPVARSRVLVGAFFVTRAIADGELSGLALIVQSVGGGLGPALSMEPTLEVEVDGEVLLDGVLVDPDMFDLTRGPWGPIESIVLPVSEFIMHEVSGGESVRVRIGDSITFEMSPEQLSGLAELLGQIPEGTRFGVRPVSRRGTYQTR